MPTFRSCGFEIYYETHGGGDGVPLLLIMGMGGTCQGWLVLHVPELSKERTNIIFDNRGAGRSQDPGTPFTTREMAEDSVALLDELGLERAHVLGGFLGGMVAQEIALSHPERVQSLILAGSFARADAKRRLLLELWQGMVEHELPAEFRIKNRLCWTLCDATLEQEDLVEGMWRFYLEEDAALEDRVFLRQAAACLEHDTSQKLGEIRAPTLIVYGEQDMLTPEHLQRELAEGIPGARLVQIPGAGHLVAAEMAPRFNGLVARFTAEHD